MRPLAGLAVLLAAALAACSNPRSVGDRSESPKATPKAEAPDDAAAKGVPPEGGSPRAPAAPEGLLAEGAVGRIQAALADRGYLKEHRQGELDDATSAAIRRFQEDEGLAATGIPDRETISHLGIAPEAAYGRAEDEAQR